MESPAASALLANDGPIARRLDHYEERPQQIAMAAAVERAFADKKHLIAEAGTGVGKSFAYLIPAILKATSGERGAKPIIISTGTIALQEQLVTKDIPFLRAVWDREFTAVLAKGRGNYLSLRRLARARENAQASLLAEERERRELDRIADWAEMTPDGSLADLDFSPEFAVWNQVESDGNNCMGRACPTYETCFYQRARRRMYTAQLLIVNHHLLCADLALKINGVSYLPDYRYLIVDEAHELEKAASEHLGLRLSRSGMIYYLNSLRNPRTGRGLLNNYARAGDAIPHVARAHVLAEAFFGDVLEMLMRSNGQSLRLREPAGFKTGLPGVLREISFALNRCLESVANEEEALELGSAARRAFTLAAGIDGFIEQDDESSVYWIEAPEGKRGRNVELHSAPIHVGELLRKHLFDASASVILTSATLATGGRTGSFGYLRDRLGLGSVREGDALCNDGTPGEGPESGTREVLLGSPFDYRKQAVVTVPEMPEPDSLGYDEALARGVIEAVQASHGGVFVLFTSYSQLRRTYDAVAPELTAAGYTLLRQGDGMPRGKLLESFVKGQSMVLFGADSFWQGVDVPGDALTAVVITRLPFAVPSEPLTAARMEAIERGGGNAFMEYSLPQAIIRLKQGFGRLIRRATDTGIVTILDSRVRRKAYGKRFLEALPPARIEMPGGSAHAFERKVGQSRIRHVE